MLDAVLYDLRKEKSLLTLMRRFKRDDWVWFGIFVGLLVLTATGIFTETIWIVVVVAIALTISVAVFYLYTKGIRMKKSIFRDIRNRWKKTEGFLNGEETRVRSVRKNRVESIRKIIDKNNFGLEENACVELLLLECNEKLGETRKSEVAKRRIKPLMVLLSIVVTSLITAYINSTFLLDEEIKAATSTIEWVREIMDAFATAIISSQNMLMLFFALCLVATIYYFVAVFMVWPILVGILDREWVLTEEVRSALLYIKYETGPEGQKTDLLDNKNKSTVVNT